MALFFALQKHLVGGLTAGSVKGERPVDYLRRYVGIVDDVEAFMEASPDPLPRTIWANPLSGKQVEIAARVMALCPEAQPLAWRKAVGLPADSNPGYWVEHVAGAIHVQEASMNAGDLVGARPGERVLDMCAAPGGKTIQMAMDMEDRGYFGSL